MLTEETGDLEETACALWAVPAGIVPGMDTDDPVLIVGVEEAFEEVEEIVIEEAADPEVVADVLPVVEEIEEAEEMLGKSILF